MRHGFELKMDSLVNEHRSADGLKLIEEVEKLQLAHRKILRSKTVEFHELQLLATRDEQKAVISTALNEVKTLIFESKMSSYRDFGDHNKVYSFEEFSAK